MRRLCSGSNHTGGPWVTSQASHQLAVPGRPSCSAAVGLQQRWRQTAPELAWLRQGCPAAGRLQEAGRGAGRLPAGPLAMAAAAGRRAAAHPPAAGAPPAATQRAEQLAAHAARSTAGHAVHVTCTAVKPADGLVIVVVRFCPPGAEGVRPRRCQAAAALWEGPQGSAATAAAPASAAAGRRPALPPTPAEPPPAAAAAAAVPVERAAALPRAAAHPTLAAGWRAQPARVPWERRTPHRAEPHPAARRPALRHWAAAAVAQAAAGLLWRRLVSRWPWRLVPRCQAAGENKSIRMLEITPFRDLHTVGLWDSATLLGHRHCTASAAATSNVLTERKSNPGKMGDLCAHLHKVDTSQETGPRQLLIHWHCVGLHTDLGQHQQLGVRLGLGARVSGRQGGAGRRPHAARLGAGPCMQWQGALRRHLLRCRRLQGRKTPKGDWLAVA